MQVVTLTETAPTTGTRSGRLVDLRYRRPSRYMIGWYALGLTAVLAAVVQPGTYRPASIQLITALAGCLLVASIGQLLIVMMGEIDLSVPAYMTLAAALSVHYDKDLGPVATAALAIVLCAGLSAVSGVLVSVVRLNSMIVTLAMNTLLAGVLVQWLGQTYSQNGSAPHWLIEIGRKDFARVNAIFLIGLLIAGIAAFVLYRTRVGRSVAAAGANRVAAQLLGIRVHAVHIATFAAAGALYAVAGSLTAGFVQTPDATLGSTYQLQTLTVVAIAGVVFSGGPASVSSLVAACLLLQTLDQALTLQGLDPGVRVLVQGVLLVLAVAAGAIARVGRGAFQTLNRRAAPAPPP